MESYRFLFDIALILFSTKLLGLITKRLQMPQVVGALVAGLIFGPAMLNILHPSNFLSSLSEVGVIVIMFTAGLTTDIHELKNAGKSGFLVALVGVVVPLAMGTGLGFLFAPEGAGASQILQHIFIGAILTATSVSITVETLKEMGKLNSKVGNTILAAALIDDILGLLVLTAVTSLAGEDVNIWFVILKVVLFFVFVGLMAFVGIKAFTWYENRYKTNLHRFPLLAFVLCLGMSFIAERFFGVADIIGAFAAGVIIANTPKASYIESKFEPLSYLLLTPIFFANIGLSVTVPKMTGSIIVFTILLLVIAVVSKLIGCGVGAKVCGFDTKESLQIGLGMVCRGEVALIVANRGAAVGLMPEEYFGPIIIMVVLCSVVTPIALKMAFHVKHSREPLPETEPSSPLVDRYELTKKLDDISEQDAFKLLSDKEQAAKERQKKSGKKS